MNRLRYVLYAVLATIVCGTGVSQCKERLDAEKGVFLPLSDAVKMVDVMEKMMIRAPRGDAPTLGDPEFPAIGSDELEIIRECVCLIKEQLDDIESTLDDCCSVIDSISTCVGDKCDEPVDFPDIINEVDIADTKASIMEWLKTIILELRGLDAP